MRKLHETLQHLQDNENPSTRFLRQALLDVVPYLVDARNKLVQLGGSGELEHISTIIPIDLNQVTVNEQPQYGVRLPELAPVAEPWRAMLDERLHKLEALLDSDPGAVIQFLDNVGQLLFIYSSVDDGESAKNLVIDTTRLYSLISDSEVTWPSQTQQQASTSSNS